MFDVRGIGLGLTDRSPFELPHRPQGPERPKRDDGTSNLTHSLRTAIAQALDEAEAAWLPRLSRYPY